MLRGDETHCIGRTFHDLSGRSRTLEKDYRFWPYDTGGGNGLDCVTSLSEQDAPISFVRLSGWGLAAPNRVSRAHFRGLLLDFVDTILLFREPLREYQEENL
jgi:hypothetical protein